MIFITKKIIKSIAVLTLNREDKLNALNHQLVKELTDSLVEIDEDQQIKVAIICGSEKSFAAGMDIKEMQGKSFSQNINDDFLKDWQKIYSFKKPLIAAVSGYALGGGFELAMACDIIYAATNAVFGQPEIGLGLIPGIGGTQRLVRAVGKSKAMEICLSATRITASEAANYNLIAKVCATEYLFEEALQLAEKISQFSLPLLKMIKESINYSFEVPLTQGLLFERRLFQAAFELEDNKEGIDAFLNKRAAAFKNK